MGGREGVHETPAAVAVHASCAGAVAGAEVAARQHERALDAGALAVGAAIGVEQRASDDAGPDARLHGGPVDAAAAAELVHGRRPAPAPAAVLLRALRVPRRRARAARLAGPSPELLVARRGALLPARPGRLPHLATSAYASSSSSSCALRLLLANT